MAVNVSQPHVLAVDDSLVDRTFIERLLKISAYRVTTVDSGRRALELLGLEGDEQIIEGAIDEMKVNMVITDYCMPGMTGYELLKKIKECAALKEIPVVIMSSENVGSRVDRCLEEGAEEFIVKPVKLSDVMRLKDYIPKKHHHQVEEEDIDPNPQDLLPPPPLQTLKRKLPSLTSSPSPQDHYNDDDDDDDVNDTSSSHSPQTTSSPYKCNDMASPTSSSPSKPPSQRRARLEKQQTNHVNASLVA